ncbi:MAG: DoxX family membrane protein [Pseudonocardia sp.]|jgi:thiosulfate dehydrogenase (quinone) large subunit
MTSTTTAPAAALAPHSALAKGFAALRIFFGLIWLSNGLAKAFGQGAYDWGFMSFNLIDLGAARFIADEASKKTYIAPLGAFYQGVVLPNWGLFGPFLTVAELAIGVALLLGVLTRAAALGSLFLITPIWLMFLDTNPYLWLYPVDLFPLLLLAIVPSGRTAGLDARLAARFGNRWPF